MPTKNLIRTVCVTDRAVLGRRTITSVGRADVPLCGSPTDAEGVLPTFLRTASVSVHRDQATCHPWLRSGRLSMVAVILRDPRVAAR